MNDQQVTYGLHSMILSNPEGISSLVGELGFSGLDGSSLVRAYIRDKQFAGKLANVVGPEFDLAFDNATGDPAKRREKISNILEAAVNGLSVLNQIVKPNQQPLPPQTQVTVRTKEDPKAKILGVPKAVFLLGVFVMVLIGFYFLLSRGK